MRANNLQDKKKFLKNDLEHTRIKCNSKNYTAEMCTQKMKPKWEAF